MNHRNANISECMSCRSRHMTEEEIMQERRNSGWNPYWAEEETIGGSRNEQSQNSWEDELSGPQQGLWGPLMGDDPMLESQRLAERDLRQLQSMYPEAAKIILPYIEEICDKMEYNGSSMYDQYPDRMTIYRLAEEIFEKVQNQFPKQFPVKKDEMLAMQYRPEKPKRPPYPMQTDQPPLPLYGYNQPGTNWVQDLVRVLLLNEMHHRRRRKKNLFN